MCGTDTKWSGIKIVNWVFVTATAKLAHTEQRHNDCGMNVRHQFRLNVMNVPLLRTSSIPLKLSLLFRLARARRVCRFSTESLHLFLCYSLSIRFGRIWFRFLFSLSFEYDFDFDKFTIVFASNENSSTNVIGVTEKQRMKTKRNSDSKRSFDNMKDFWSFASFHSLICRISTHSFEVFFFYLNIADDLNETNLITTLLEIPLNAREKTTHDFNYRSEND